MKTLDRIALVFICLGLLVVAYAANGDLFWLVLAAIAFAVYAWRKNDAETFRICCYMPLAYTLGFGLCIWLFGFGHRRIDSQLMALDHGVGIGVWHWCSAHPWTIAILFPVYFAMGPWILLNLVLSGRRPEMIRALILGSVLSCVSYFFFPAVGPRWIATGAPFPNGIPSMHLGFALICYVYATRPITKTLTFIFALLTVAATMGLGEHYAVDLVAAFPFTWLVCLLARHTGSFVKSYSPAPKLSASARSLDSV